MSCFYVGAERCSRSGLQRCGIDPLIKTEISVSRLGVLCDANDLSLSFVRTLNSPHHGAPALSYIKKKKQPAFPTIYFVVSGPIP